MSVRAGACPTTLRGTQCRCVSARSPYKKKQAHSLRMSLFISLILLRWQRVSQNTIIARIRYPDKSCRVNGDAGSQPDLCRPSTIVAPRAHEVPIVGEFDHAISFGVGDKD